MKCFHCGQEHKRDTCVSDLQMIRGFAGDLYCPFCGRKYRITNIKEITW